MEETGVRRTGIEQLVGRWISDPAFRVEVDRDPRAAARRGGIELSEREWALLRRTGEWLLADESPPRGAGAAIPGAGPHAAVGRSWTCSPPAGRGDPRREPPCRPMLE
jgi:hypothetical protein